jgi:hypothetical protein
MNYMTVLTWAAVAIFVAAAAIWLLDMIGKVTIRTPAQRTMLNASLGVTLIGGIATLVANGMGGAGKSAQAQPAAALASAAATAPTAGTTPANEPPPQPPADPDPAPSSTPTDPPQSETVIAFLAANNLTRPMIAPDWDSRYPPCARQARAATLPGAEARRCYRALDTFNTAVLIPYQDAYERYVPAVTDLSLSQPEGEVLIFLQADSRGFTQGTLAEATLYRRISNEFFDDKLRLRKQAYR